MTITNPKLAVFALVLSLCSAGAAGPSSKPDANARTIPDLRLDLVWIQMPKAYGPPYWIGKTEVTQKQWAALMKRDYSEFKGDDLPVQNVASIEALEFCRKLTEKERQAGRVPEGYVFSLPTNAQWEFACRAGTLGDFPGNIDDMAWYFLNSGGKPHTIATKQPNGWGLYDMLGNVAEWTLNSLADYSTQPPALTTRSIRGGSWRIAASQASSTFRISYSAGDRQNTVGFRVVLSAVTVTEKEMIPTVRDPEKVKKAILDNLRQVAAIAEQYLLEHPGDHVAVRDITGYERSFNAIIPFDGEDYQSLVYERGKPLKVSTKTLGDLER